MLDRLWLVLKSRYIIFDTIGNAIETVSEKENVGRLSEATEKRKELMQKLESRMEVVDEEREDRVERARNLSDSLTGRKIKIPRRRLKEKQEVQKCNDRKEQLEKENVRLEQQDKLEKQKKAKNPFVSYWNPDFY